MSRHELRHQLFMAVLRDREIPEPEAELRFHGTRKWRFDYAWPQWMIALEVEGGSWKRGRHNRPTGFQKDMEKYNEAAVLGWMVLRVTPDQLVSDQCAELLMRAAARRLEEGASHDKRARPDDSL